MRLKTALLPLTMPLVLAACLGGGGGSGSSSGGQSGPLTLNSTPTAFTSFDDITANSLVEATAPTSVNYAADVVGGNVSRLGVLSDDGSSLRILTGAEIPPEVEGDDPELEFGGLRLTVNLPEDATIVRDFMEEPAEVGTGLAADRFVAFEIDNDDDAATDRLYTENGDLNFMTFGLWELDLTETSRDIGGAAWGAMTPLAGAGVMPTGGTATYQGDLIGYNVLAASTTIYVAQSNLEANFGTNAVTFSSTGTRNLETGVAESNFNILATSGTITGNTFSGSGLDLAASQFGPDFAGEFGGAFFGAEAAEAGGWFEIRNTDNSDRYFGSFGGAQP